MKFATVRDLKNRTSEMIRRAADTDVVVTSHGRPVAILHGIREGDLEDWVLANHPALRASYEEAERDYRKRGGVRLEDFIRTLKAKTGGGRRNGRAQRRS